MSGPARKPAGSRAEFPFVTGPKMKSIHFWAVGLLCLANLPAAPLPEVMGGLLSAEELKLVRQDRASRTSDRVEIFALVCTGGSVPTKIPLFEIRNLPDNLDKDLVFENPEFQILLQVRISKNTRGNLTIAHSLCAGSWYLDYRNIRDGAKRQIRFPSVLHDGKPLLLLGGTPTVLHRNGGISTHLPFDPSKPVRTENTSFTLIALRG